MKSLIRIHDLNSPNHSSLEATLNSSYPANAGRIVLAVEADQLVEQMKSPALNELLFMPRKSAHRRYLAISIHGDDKALSSMSIEAITLGTINGAKLAADVDLYIMAHKTEQPELFEEARLNKMPIVDFMRTSAPEAHAALNQRIEAFHEAKTPYVMPRIRAKANDIENSI